MTEASYLETTYTNDGSFNVDLCFDGQKVTIRPEEMPAIACVLGGMWGRFVADHASPDVAAVASLARSVTDAWRVAG